MNRAIIAVLLIVPTLAVAKDGTLAQRVADRVKTQIPNATVAIKDENTVRIELAHVASVDANLDNVRHDCAVAANCEAAVGALVAALKEGFDKLTIVPEVSQLRVRISDRRFIDDLEAKLSAAPAEARAKGQPITREWVKGLWLVLVLDNAKSIQMMQRRFADDLGKTDDALFAAAISNLRRTLPLPTFQPMVVNPQLKIQSSSTDGYDAAYLLLPDLLAKAAGSDVLVAVPSRDTLLFANKKDATELKKATAVLFAKANHPVSDALFVLSAKGVTPL